MSLIALTESDAFALAMLGVIFLGLGVVGMLLLCMAKHACRRDFEVENLIEEVTAMEKTNRAPVTKSHLPNQEPWEKDGDWWRK
jgi:hypothetical protein